MWLKVFLCGLLFFPACSSTPESQRFEAEASPQMQENPFSSWLKQRIPRLRALQEEFWPDDTDLRYAQHTMRFSFEYPTESVDADALRTALVDYFEQREHPEAQCVSYELQRLNESWTRFVAQVICF